jgi:hypothetical protein
MNTNQKSILEKQIQELEQKMIETNNFEKIMSLQGQILLLEKKIKELLK